MAGLFVQRHLLQQVFDACFERGGGVFVHVFHPPATTDFGIMFLPFEGIYAEVVRRSSLLEELQRNYKVVVTGPTTLAAILNSLQMGFRTLAIQKHSGEVCIKWL